MEQYLLNLFAGGWYYQSLFLLGMALFFLMVGLRELREQHPESYLYLILAIFFSMAHMVILTNFPEDTPLGQYLSQGFWAWLVIVLAPVIIALFVCRGIYNLMVRQGHDGLVKIFFGLTLLCFLHLIGYEWPVDVRGVFALVWAAILFKTELAIAS